MSTEFKNIEEFWSYVKELEKVEPSYEGAIPTFKDFAQSQRQMADNCIIHNRAYIDQFKKDKISNPAFTIGLGENNTHSVIFFRTEDDGWLVFDPTFGQIVLGWEKIDNQEVQIENGFFLGSIHEYFYILNEVTSNVREERYSELRDFVEGKSSEEVFNAFLGNDMQSRYKEPVLNPYYNKIITNEGTNLLKFGLVKETSGKISEECLDEDDLYMLYPHTKILILIRHNPPEENYPGKPDMSGDKKNNEPDKSK